MDREEAAKIERIQSIYNAFMAELDGLKKQQSTVVAKALQHIDHQRIQDILKALHQS